MSKVLDCIKVALAGLGILVGILLAISPYLLAVVGVILAIRWLI